MKKEVIKQYIITEEWCSCYYCGMNYCGIGEPGFCQEYSSPLPSMDTERQHQLALECSQYIPHLSRIGQGIRVVMRPVEENKRWYEKDSMG